MVVGYPLRGFLASEANVGTGAARAFLDAEGVPYETAPSDNATVPVEVAAAARKFTVFVECWNWKEVNKSDRLLPVWILPARSKAAPAERGDCAQADRPPWPAPG